MAPPVSKPVVWQGRSYTRRELADKIGITVEAMRQRLKYWSIEHAVTLPAGVTAPFTVNPRPKDYRRNRLKAKLPKNDVSAPPRRSWQEKLEM